MKVQKINASKPIVVPRC